MTKGQFAKKRFGEDTKCVYRGEVWDIVTVDREEALIAIPNEKGIIPQVSDEVKWVRCENVVIID